MSDIKEIGLDFNLEVDAQGEKLENMNQNLDIANKNTGLADEQLQQANQRHRASGRCLIWVAVIIILCLAGLLGILFGTHIIG